MNAPVARHNLGKRKTLLVTWKRTTSELPNVLSPVILVEKTFITAPLSKLIFAPLINDPSLQLENALLKKLQMLRPRKDLRGRTKQVRVPLQNQLPQQVLKTPLLAGNLILFSFQRTLFPVAKKTLPKCTGNTGHKFVPGLVAKTDYKIGIISACPRSVPLLSANNWTASLLTNLQFSKSTCRLVLSSVIQRLRLSNTTIHPSTTWCWFRPLVWTSKQHRFPRVGSTAAT